jgi:hypothetical protein
MMAILKIRLQLLYEVHLRGSARKHMKSTTQNELDQFKQPSKIAVLNTIEQ